MCFLSLPFVLMACGGNLVKIDYDSGTLQYRQYSDESQVFSDLKVIGTLSNGRKKLLDKRDLHIGHVDTTTKGEQQITLTYNNISTTLTVFIYSEEANTNIRITGYEQAENITLYNANRQNTDFSNKSNAFKKNNEPYYVGDINDFVYFPLITGYSVDDSGSTIDLIPETILGEFESQVQIERKNADDSYTLLGTSEPGTYDNGERFVVKDESNNDIVAVDTLKGLFDFYPQTAGQTYRITQKPTRFTYPLIDDNVLTLSRSVEVVVVGDGYNAYRGIDLGVVDNYYYCNQKPQWQDFKKANNIYDGNAKAVILHNAIQLSTNDIPSDFVANGTNGQYIKNDITVYSRWLEDENDSFEFIGNYFNLDLSQINLIPPRDDNNLDGWSSSYAYTAIFEVFATRYHTLDQDGNPVPDEEGKIYKPNDQSWLQPPAMSKAAFKNFSTIGNSIRSNNENTLGFGGFTFMRQSTNFVDLSIDNVNIRHFLIAGEFINDSSIRTISNTRIFDQFNFSFNLFAAGQQNYIVNSELKDSGGPMVVVLSDEARDSAGNPRPRYDSDGIPHDYQPDGKLWPRQSTFNIDRATEIENFIQGTEAWFNAMGASAMVAPMKDISNKLSSQSKVYDPDNPRELSRTIDDQQQLNLIAIVLPTSNFSQAYDYNTNPFNGGINVIDNIDNQRLINEFDFGNQYKWTQKADDKDGGMLVTEYLNQSNMTINLVKGAGTGRESFAIKNNSEETPMFAPRGDRYSQTPLNDKELESLFGQDNQYIEFNILANSLFAKVSMMGILKYVV